MATPDNSRTSCSTPVALGFGRSSDASPGSADSDSRRIDRVEIAYEEGTVEPTVSGSHIAPPLIVLTPGHSLSTLATGILASHPEMYGLLSTHLLVRDTMQEWFEDFGSNSYADGLSRVVSEVVFSCQTVANVKRAKHWLWRRRHWTTQDVLKEIAERLFPLVCIERSPMVTFKAEHMQRARHFFPEARFLHIVRHPFSYCRSVLNFVRRNISCNSKPQQSDSEESPFFKLFDEMADRPALDPQWQWHARNSLILSFAAELKPEQYLRIRVEDLIARPLGELERLSNWLGLRADAGAVERSTHPEDWRFAHLGPWNARLGGDFEFFRKPVLGAPVLDSPTLDTTLPWRRDGSEFAKEICNLATQFGYA